MVLIHFISSDGQSRTVDGPEGSSVMEVAVRNGIEGIIAECGGSCACATCHVHIPPDWLPAVGHASGSEAELLEFVRLRTDASRLSCQIRLHAALDGLTVLLPESQR